MNIVSIRDNLTARLAAGVPGVRWYDRWPGRLSAGAGTIERVAGPERLTFGRTGTCRADFEVVLLAGPATLAKRSGDKLDALLGTDGAGSVVAAIEADPTLGGLVDYVTVGEPADDDEIAANGIDWVGVRIPVEVYGP